MASTADIFTGVQIDLLPPPAVVEAADYATLRDQLLSQLAGLFPDFASLGPSDPAMKLVELFAYREFLLRARINESAVAIMPAFASGPDLDHIGSRIGLARQSDETDTSYRTRIVRGPEGYSVAGPAGAYLVFAEQAHPDVRFVAVTSPAPAEVLVTVQSRVGNGAPTNAVLTAVSAFLSDATRRPIGDRVTVQGAQILNFAIEATIKTFAHVNPVVVIAAARARLQAWLSDNCRLGRDITTDAIIAQLRVDGVQKVSLISPAIDIVTAFSQAAFATQITLNHGGVGE